VKFCAHSHKLINGASTMISIFIWSMVHTAPRQMNLIRASNIRAPVLKYLFSLLFYKVISNFKQNSQMLNKIWWCHEFSHPREEGVLRQRNWAADNAMIIVGPIVYIVNRMHVKMLLWCLGYLFWCMLLFCFYWILCILEAITHPRRCLETTQLKYLTMQW
jgi:hypothetical protein